MAQLDQAWEDGDLAPPEEQTLQRAGGLGAAPPNTPPPPRSLPCTAMHGLLGSVLDELDQAVLICSPEARLVTHNRSARHALSGHRHLQMQGDVLVLRQPDQQPLWHALRLALRGKRNLLALGEGDARQYLACAPLSAPDQVLVLLGRERACSPLALEMFCAQHQLTHAERRVLQALIDGLRPADMAQDFGVALSTVRTQVATIRAKLGAERIESLMQMAAGLPPLAALLGHAPH